MTDQHRDKSRQLHSSTTVINIPFVTTPAAISLLPNEHKCLKCKCVPCACQVNFSTVNGLLNRENETAA